MTRSVIALKRSEHRGNMTLRAVWVLLWALGVATVAQAAKETDPASSQGVACHCEKVYWAIDESFASWQLVSDFFIAVAYFSIPVELIYFVHKSQVFPFKWILLQFGAFIILCGLTHLIAMFCYGPHSHTIMMIQTLAKALTAIVSCATGVTLIYIIPEMLSLKVRELFLRTKAAELDREMGIIRTQEEASRSVRMLTHEIRSTLDRHTILRTTLVELARTLDLENCTIWMPSSNGRTLELTHELERRLVNVSTSVHVTDPTVLQVFNTRKAITVPAYSPIGAASSRKGMQGGVRQDMAPVAAVRLPLLSLSHFGEGGDFTAHEESFALMVLVLPSGSARLWRPHELEMVEVVADQVAVALSHAAVLEESQRARQKLVEQNAALDAARQEAESAIRARNDFLAVMNHEMRTPMHAVIALSSLLIETQLSEEQRSMVDTVVKSGTVLSTLINDVLDFSRLEDGSLALDPRPFELHTVLRETENLASPMARAKNLRLSVHIEKDVPLSVVGDDKRLLQTLLNLVGNGVKFTEKGSVRVDVSVNKPGRLPDPGEPYWTPRHEKGSVYVRISVADTGLGIRPTDIPKLFKKFVQADSTTTRMYGGTGLGLAICRKFVELMQGVIWIRSEGLGKGATTSMVVRLGLQPNGPVVSVPRGVDAASTSSPEGGVQPEALQGLRILVTDDNSVNRLVTRRLLDKLGCRTTLADSGERCLAELAKPGAHFQILFLDLCMPVMDGYEVASRIRDKHPPGKRPLVIALTANTDKKTRDQCLERGMDGIVLKPITLNELRDVMCSLVVSSAGFTRVPSAGEGYGFSTL